MPKHVLVASVICCGIKLILPVLAAVHYIQACILDRCFLGQPMFAVHGKYRHCNNAEAAKEYHQNLYEASAAVTPGKAACAASSLLSVCSQVATTRYDQRKQEDWK